MSAIVTQPESSAVEVIDDEALGEWLHEQLVRTVGTDDDPWALTLVGKVRDRLNAARRPQPPMETVLLFEGELSAFVGPGRYVYLTRGLLHRDWWEEGLALVLAHEMAHRDLGHTRVFKEKLQWLPAVPVSFAVCVARIVAQRMLAGPEQEAAADALGLDLCLKAGFDGRRCVEAMDVLERYALDAGDIDGAYGPEENASTPGDLAAWMSAGRKWVREHVRGYPSVRERKEALLRRLQAA